MKLNQTLTILALAAGGLFAGSLALQAQTSTNAPPPLRARGLNFDNIAKQLDLTEAQKPKVKAVIDDYNQKMIDLRKDSSIAPTELRSKIKEIYDAMTAKLKAILTADQFAKWQKIGAGGSRPIPATGATPAGPPAPQK